MQKYCLNQNCKLTHKLLWYVLVADQNVIENIAVSYPKPCFACSEQEQNKFLKQKTLNSNFYSNKQPNSNKQRYLLEQFV